MKTLKMGICILITTILVAYTPAPDEPDPGYAKAFGYGSIAASIGGRPAYAQFVASQFDYQNGIFYVKAGADRLDLRALLPQGQTYEKMMNALFKAQSSKLNTKKDESIYWVAWATHDLGGNRIYPDWKAGSPAPDYQGKYIWKCSLNYEPAKDWTGCAIYYDDPEETTFKEDVGTWLKYAKPGMQLYVMNTVGFTRDVKEAAYWDYSQGKTVTPLEFVLEDKTYAYCIIQVK